MSGYKTILLAVDLSDEAHAVAKRAHAIATGNGGTIHIIHVIEPLSFAYGGDIPMDFSSIQTEIQHQAKIQMQKFASQYQISEANQHLVLGRAESEIHTLAESLNADLIVIGSHGRSGLSLLLGSTANGVLHGAVCDVLAVRVGKE
jgi:universal stress protein A